MSHFDAIVHYICPVQYIVHCICPVLWSIITYLPCFTQYMLSHFVQYKCLVLFSILILSYFSGCICLIAADVHGLISVHKTTSTHRSTGCTVPWGRPVCYHTQSMSCQVRTIYTYLLCFSGCVLYCVLEQFFYVPFYKFLFYISVIYEIVCI